MAQPNILLGPAAYDGISAKLTEDAGFDFGFMSGFSVAAARLGLPDTGLVSYGEMVEQGRQMIEATKHMPLIGDGDTGGGNSMNVKRTVRGYAAAGFSGTTRDVLGTFSGPTRVSVHEARKKTVTESSRT